MKNFKKIMAMALAMVSMIGVTTYGVGSINLNNSIEVSADTTTEKAQQLFELVNKYRAENNLKPFKTCSVMNQMATVRAKEITTGVYITRGDGDNKTLYNSIFTEYKINTTMYNQNTYWGGVGFDTPEYALEQFKESARQNANMLSNDYEYLGIGVYVENNKTYYYQLFCTSSDLKEDVVSSVTSQPTVTTTTTTTTPVTSSATVTTTTTVTQPTVTVTEPTTTTTIPTTSSTDDLLKKYNLDVNKNGVVNTIDLLILKRYLLGTLKG